MDAFVCHCHCTRPFSLRGTARTTNVRRGGNNALCVRRAIAQGKSYSGKLLNFAKDGSPLWNQLSIVPVRTKSLAVTHYIGMQSFSKADVATPTSSDVVPTLARRSSHNCLGNLDTDACHPDAPGVPKRSSSYQVLSAMNPELFSAAGSAVHGCVGALLST
jgi:hypothetical protein